MQTLAQLKDAYAAVSYTMRSPQTLVTVPELFCVLNVACTEGVRSRDMVSKYLCMTDSNVDAAFELAERERYGERASDGELCHFEREVNRQGVRRACRQLCWECCGT